MEQVDTVGKNLMSNEMETKHEVNQMHMTLRKKKKI